MKWGENFTSWVSIERFLVFFLVFYKLKGYDFSSNTERIFKKYLVRVSVFRQNNKIMCRDLSLVLDLPFI